MFLISLGLRLVPYQSLYFPQNVNTEQYPPIAHHPAKSHAWMVMVVIHAMGDMANAWKAFIACVLPV